MASLEEQVNQSLRDQGATQGTLDLWTKIHDAYEEGGPEAVSTLLEGKVREIRRAAKAQAAGMREAVGAVKPKSRAKKRR